MPGVLMADYWRLDLLLAAIGVSITALITLLVERGKDRDAVGSPRVGEPLRSVVVSLLYLSVLYPFAGWVSAAVQATRPVAVYLVLCAAAGAAHGVGLAVQAHTRRELTAAAGAARSLAVLPAGIEDSQLADSLLARSARSGRVRIVLPDVTAVNEGRGVFGAAVQKAAQNGTDVQAVTSPMGEPWVAIDVGDSTFIGVGGNPNRWEDWPLLTAVRDDGTPCREFFEWSSNQIDVLSARSNVERAEVSLSTSPAAYRHAILAAEDDALRIDRIPKRISVIFKDPATVEGIAIRRFGPGSSNIEHYVSEHEERRRIFFAALQRGAHCREIYNVEEVLEYVRSRHHGPNVTLTPDEMLTTLRRWRDAVLHQPNYQVALTWDRVPFKYEIVDDRLVVMHEAIGSADRHRLNAIFIRSRSVAMGVREDFETLWDRSDPQLRTPAHVVDWIETILIPAATQP
jgi:hypothetical protein